MRKYKSKIISKKCPDCGVLIHVHVDNDKEIKCSGCHVVWSVIRTNAGVDLSCRPGERLRPSSERSLTSWCVLA